MLNWESGKLVQNFWEIILEGFSRMNFELNFNERKIQERILKDNERIRWEVYQLNESRYFPQGTLLVMQ